MLCFASCLHGVIMYDRGSVEFYGVGSLIFLSGYSNVAISFVCVGYLLVLVVYLLVAPLSVSSPLQHVN